MSELAYQEMWVCISQESDPDWTLLRLLQEGVWVFLKATMLEDSSRSPLCLSKGDTVAQRKKVI